MHSIRYCGYKEGKNRQTLLCQGVGKANPVGKAKSNNELNLKLQLVTNDIEIKNSNEQMYKTRICSNMGL